MKTRFFTAAIALCLLGFTGCNKERMNDAGTQVGNPVMMTLQTGSPETRADYTPDGQTMKFSWRANDEMSVVIMDGTTDNENCKLTATADGKSAPFSGTVTGFTGTKDIYAIYPYSDTPYSIADGGTPTTATVALTLPNPQSYTVGGAITNSYLVGAGTATANNTAITASAGMKQVMSFIKLNITNATDKAVTGVKLSCEDALFPTTATVKLNDAVVSSSSNTVNALTMNVTDGTDTDTKAVSFAMFPADLTNKSITIYVTFDNRETFTLTKTGVKFERNVHYELEFNTTAATLYRSAGDYYLNDGTIVDKATELTADQKAKCLGIVFYINPDVTSGKIVGLTEPIANWNNSGNAAGKLQWSAKQVTTGATDVNNGRTNMTTLAVFIANTANSTSWTDYPAFKWVTEQNNNAGNWDAANDKWYLPANEELKALYGKYNGNTNVDNKVKVAVNTSLNAIGAKQIADTHYCASTEYSSSSSIFLMGFSNGRMASTTKPTATRVRCIREF